MTCFIENTAQKMKFSIKDFFSKCDQIRRFLWIWSYLLKKYLMENFIFCAVKTALSCKIRQEAASKQNSRQPRKFPQIKKELNK